MPVDTSDTESAGAALAHDVGGYPRNTILTHKILGDLAAHGQKRILIRSPILGGPREGGVYGLDAGVRERGDVAPTGDFVGVAAANALCLAEGTEVRMADGSSKRIEQIVVGERVLGSSTLGIVRPVTVLSTFANGARDIYETVFRLDTRQTVENNILKLRSTLEHKVLSVLVKRHDPRHLKAQIRAVAAPTNKSERYFAKLAFGRGWCRLVSQNPVGRVLTYDLGVDHPDHLFVLANGLIVHNSEPLTQATLSAKHSGGVAGASKGATGFKLLNQLVQIPKSFPAGAAHAQKDGQVEHIEEAPQGGTYIHIDGKRHHAAVGHDVFVKRGDQIEAGDVLSEGVPNPAEIVKHKGIGEGRRYFTHTFRDAFKRSGMGAERRNIEMLARGLIDHVQLTDEVGEHAPDDVVPYSTIEHDYEPREDAVKVKPKKALGMYLEAPVLHHTIGTRVKSSMIKDLEEFGINEVHAHPEPPPFQPVMIRGLENTAHDPDWLTRFLGSYVKKNFLHGVHRGHVANEQGSSFVPSLVRGADFNASKNIVKSFKPLPSTLLPKPT